jgi:hypothetical protein
MHEQAADVPLSGRKCRPLRAFTLDAEPEAQTSGPRPGVPRPAGLSASLAVSVESDAPTLPVAQQRDAGGTRGHDGRYPALPGGTVVS